MANSQTQASIAQCWLLKQITNGHVSCKLAHVSLQLWDLVIIIIKRTWFHPVTPRWFVRYSWREKQIFEIKSLLTLWASLSWEQTAGWAGGTCWYTYVQDVIDYWATWIDCQLQRSFTGSLAVGLLGELYCQGQAVPRGLSLSSPGALW